MTNDKDFKRLVRARMAETGETYTRTRAALLEAGAASEENSSSLPLDARIFVSGHAGLVGSALLDKLRGVGYENLLTARRDQLDLRDQAAVNYWFKANRPEYVFLVAGTVGGVLANSTHQARFLYDNMMIHATVVEAAHQYRVQKLLYLGSSCIYPRLAPQPISEDALLTGPLEPTNEGYALAKIAGIKLCQFSRQEHGDNFIAAMPTNLYGPNDNFDAESAHLVPMLMRRFHEAKARGDRDVVVWGTGEPRRELLHVEDLADACLFLMRHHNDDQFVNVGTGQDLHVREIARLIRDVVHPGAALKFDTSMPDGMPRKLLDVSRLHALGWHHRIDLASGLRSAYEWFCAAHDVRGVPLPTHQAAAST